ncbi:alpha-N-arabinofuranosidase [Halioxenophilus aromaticivorans]|uniref:non-reducing end alpha-L-arabinofuranosidase n=1 Tax=Halioxenophilus aromaticivorans TaxID=1306992 RepID=A0AAV3U2N9_9ALTE
MNRQRFANWTLGYLMLAASHTALADKITVTPMTDEQAPVIARHIYGQFSEHLGRGIYDGVWVGEDSNIANTRGIRNDVVAALKAIQVPVIRWPGGCFADEYHWRDGIGPRQQRPVRKNNWWGGTPEDNAFGTHEFFDFVEQIGADAYVSVNVASSTPTQMREWIEYMTSTGQDTLANERRSNGREQPFGVPFIGIGNESWGCGGNMTPEYYSNLYRRWAAFFHKNGSNFHQQNDNKALRVASGANNLDTNWTKVVMEQAGHGMDAISLHFYTLWTGDWPKRNEAAATEFNQDHWFEILYQASRMEEVLQAHEKVMDKIDPDKRIGLYVDEWGTWYNTEPGTNPGHLYQQNTLRDALVAAISLNIFHQHADRVRMANIAQTVNVLQAMLLTEGAAMAKTPSYYVFKMHLPFHDAKLLPLRYTSPQLTAPSGKFAAISLSAALPKEGGVVISLANSELTQQHELSVNLGDLQLTNVSGEILTADSLDAHNLPGKPETVSPSHFTGATLDNGNLTVNLPAKSVVVLRVR